MVSKAVTIGRRATGLVQNGMVAAGASEIFLKSTGKSCSQFTDTLTHPRRQVKPDFLCDFQFRGCYNLKMTPDPELLRQFARTNSQDAFAELVKRHVNLVYSAALRQVNGDGHLAKDVAQTVFTDLARKAASLSRRETLTGWLYTSAHFAAAKIVRGENRRRDPRGKIYARTNFRNRARSRLGKNSARRSTTPCTNSRKLTAKPFCCATLRTGSSPKSARNSASTKMPRGCAIERALEKLRGISHQARRHDGDGSGVRDFRERDSNRARESGGDFDDRFNCNCRNWNIHTS